MHGRDKAARLIEHIILQLRLLPRFQAHAVELDDVLLRIRTVAETRSVAVEAHAPGFDQHFGAAAGDVRTAGQYFLQAFFHWILLICGYAGVGRASVAKP